MLRLSTTFRSPWLGLSLALGLLVTPACDDAEPVVLGTTVVSTASTDGRFGTLASLLVEQQLAATLSGPGPFTVFAPTDDAFAGLPAGTVDSLRADGSLDTVLKYHVVAERLTAADVVARTSLTTLAGVELPVVVEGDVVKVGGATVTQTDVTADNGIIHVIDGVLVPPAEPAGDDIVETANAAGNFTTLLAAVEAAGLTGILKGEGKFTVFAPTDAAFALLPAGTVEALLEDIPTLTNILTYHAYAGELNAAAVTAETSLKMLNGDNAAIAIVDGKATIAGVVISATDIQTSNGIIHVLDAVMMPPAPPTDDIIETATANGSFGTLLAAVDAAGLTATLKGEGPFTVFAPTDAAFAALPEGTVDSLLADIPALTDILTYHVVAGELDAEAVLASSTIEMFNKVRAQVALEGGVATIGGATISMTDIKTSNGIIHVIDAVIQPPPTILETAEAAGSFATLIAAVDAAGLTATLDGEGPFTVFAPTDAAFEALPEGTVDALLQDIPTLTDILTYHVAGDYFLAADVLAATELGMLNEETAAIALVDGEATIAGSVISTTDVLCRNGVIHIIDAVMMPPMDN